jgi:hypothetical protein
MGLKKRRVQEEKKGSERDMEEELGARKFGVSLGGIGLGYLYRYLVGR